MLGLVQPLGAAGRGDAEGPERNLRALPPDRRTTSLGCHCRVAPEGLLPMWGSPGWGDQYPPLQKMLPKSLRGCSGGGEEGARLVGQGAGGGVVCADLTADTPEGPPRVAPLRLPLTPRHPRSTPPSQLSQRRKPQYFSFAGFSSRLC